MQELCYQNIIFLWNFIKKQDCHSNILNKENATVANVS